LIKSRRRRSLLPLVFGRVLVVTTRGRLAQAKAESWRSGLIAGMRAEHAARSEDRTARRPTDAQADDGGGLPPGYP
jgi:hypothetical protein